MSRDTYWIKPSKNNNQDPFGNFFFSRPNLAHEPIGSNQADHSRSSPARGRTSREFQRCDRTSQDHRRRPSRLPSVSVGEPVTIHFTVNGEANFSFTFTVPTLPSDPDWKSYVPSSKTQYLDQSHTQGTKTFEQAVKSSRKRTACCHCRRPASAATLTPPTKRYVTSEVALPAITVTGTLATPAAPATRPAPDADQTTVANARYFHPGPQSHGSGRSDHKSYPFLSRALVLGGPGEPLSRRCS